MPHTHKKVRPNFISKVMVQNVKCITIKEWLAWFDPFSRITTNLTLGGVPLVDWWYCPLGLNLIRTGSGGGSGVSMARMMMIWLLWCAQRAHHRLTIINTIALGSMQATKRWLFAFLWGVVITMLDLDWISTNLCSDVDAKVWPCRTFARGVHRPAKVSTENFCQSNRPALAFASTGSGRPNPTLVVDIYYIGSMAPQLCHHTQWWYCHFRFYWK